MPPAGATRIRALAIACLMAGGLTGCDSEPPAERPDQRFSGEYVDPSQSPVGLRLTLHPEGDFTLLECDARGDDTWFATGERETIARGTWRPSGDRVRLVSDAWEVVLVADSIAVSIPDRADTLDGLRWVSGSVSTSLDAVRFVNRSQFADFLHPPEGSGTSGGGL